MPGSRSPIRAVRRCSARASRSCGTRPTERSMHDNSSIDRYDFPMIRPLAFVLGLASVVLPAAAFGQAKSYALSTTDGLRLHNTTAEAVTFKDRKAVRVAVSPDVTRRPEYLAGTTEPETFVRIEGLAFSNGVIEVEIASAPAEGAGPG